VFITTPRADELPDGFPLDVMRVERGAVSWNAGQRGRPVEAIP
jgi:hypothetical protein